MSGHAPLAPSSIKYTLLCPGRRFAPKQPQTVYTIMGNTAHAIAKETIDKKLPELPELSEGYGKVRVYTDYVINRATESLQTEVKLTHPNIKDFWGTIDTLNYVERELQVIDLKWGMYDVPIKNNPQVMSYLVLARHSIPNATDYFGAIIQPRIKKPIKEASFSAAQLDKFEQQVALVSFQEHRIPGNEQCRFCTLKPNCPEYKQAKRSGEVKV